MKTFMKTKRLSAFAAIATAAALTVNALSVSSAIAEELHYYLFAKKSRTVMEKLRNDYPFPYEDDGTIILLKEGTDKNALLRWKDEVRVRLGIPVYVGVFTESGFRDFVSEENFNYVSSLISDLERLKDVIRQVKSKDYNPCYYVSLINEFEGKLLKRYGATAYGLLESIKVDFSCYLKEKPTKTVDDVNEFVGKLLVKYSEHPDVVNFLEKLIA